MTDTYNYKIPNINRLLRNWIFHQNEGRQINEDDRDMAFERRT